MPRLLLVTYEFPPKGGPGVQRPAKLCKYLARAGWDVSVLTVADPPTALRDESLLRDIPDSVTVLRSWSAEPTRLLLWLRGLRGGAPAGPQGSGGSLSGASPGTIRAVKALFVPDEKRFWLPWARRAGLRHLARYPADVILSTGPPHTAHLVAMALSRRTGIPFVIDFRDPWIGNVSLVTPTPLHRWLHARSERRVARRAAAMVTVSETMTERLRERYPSAQVVTIPNGFDAEDLPPRAASGGDRLQGTPGRLQRHTSGRLRLVYAGTFSPPRTPDLFFGGLAAAEASDPAIGESLEVVMVGAGAEVESVATELGLKTPVEGRGYVSHEQALEVLAGADVALLVLSPGRESEVSLTGKLFEYLGMRLPVLAVVGEGEVSRLAGQIAGITVADPSDPEAVGAALVALTNAWKAGTLKEPGEEDVAVFDRRSQAELFSALLEDVARGGAPNA